MRFLCLYKPHPSFVNGPPSPEVQVEMGKLIDEMVKAGVLLATEGFTPSPTDVRVRLSEGKLSVTDGPFTEAKEVIGGFALIQVKSRDEAIEWTKRFLRTMGAGESEIHQLPEGAQHPLG